MVGLDHPGDARGDILVALGIPAHGLLWNAALAPHLQPPCQRRLGIVRGPRGVLMVGMHPQLAAGTVDDRGGLAPMVRMCMSYGDQPDVIEAKRHLAERSLEVGERVSLVHPRIDQHNTGPGCDRPGVAVRNSGPWKGEA